MSSLQTRRLRIFGFLVLGVVIFSLSVVLAYPSTCLPQILTNNGQQYVQCTGITSLWQRDQLQQPSNGVIPYLNYPIEYFFLAGPIELFINLIGHASGMNTYAVIYFSNIIMGLCAIGLLPVFYKLGTSVKRVALLYVFTPIGIIYGLSFEYLQILLVVLSYFYFRSAKEKTSAFLFALACGLKMYPVVLLPLFLKHTVSKLRFVLVTIVTLGTGILIEFFLSPANFVRIFSYFSHYGVEGSWLGLLFPSSVIDYGNTTTYNIGGATPVLGLPKFYEVISFVIVLIGIYLIYRAKSLNLEEGLLLGFSVLYICLWISAPQFAFNILGLLPLVSRVKLNLSTLIPFYGFVIFASNVWWFTFNFNAGLLSSLYIQSVSEVFLVLLLVVNFGLHRSPVDKT